MHEVHSIQDNSIYPEIIVTGRANALEFVSIDLNLFVIQV